MFVENLDNYFGNVCELDIVFNFHKVYGILDEIVVGGEVLETAKDIIVASLKNLEIEDWLHVLSSLFNDSSNLTSQAWISIGHFDHVRAVALSSTLSVS